MRKAVSVLALLLALTCSAYAGDMPNGTPAQPPQSSQEAMTDGDISCPPLVEIALSLFALI